MITTKEWNTIHDKLYKEIEENIKDSLEILTDENECSILAKMGQSNLLRSSYTEKHLLRRLDNEIKEISTPESLDAKDTIERHLVKIRLEEARATLEHEKEQTLNKIMMITEGWVVEGSLNDLTLHASELKYAIEVVDNLNRTILD